MENEPIENENKGEPIIKYDKEKIKILIINSLEKPLSFHIMNLKSNDIILKKNHIKYLLQKFRENNFPSDSKFLNDISQIMVTLDESNNNLTNIQICYSYNNIINIKNKNRLEKFIIFTNIFQLNMVKKCTQIFIDGTFKSCQRGFIKYLILQVFYQKLTP